MFTPARPDGRCWLVIGFQNEDTRAPARVARLGQISLPNLASLAAATVARLGGEIWPNLATLYPADRHEPRSSSRAPSAVGASPMTSPGGHEGEYSSNITIFAMRKPAGCRLLGMDPSIAILFIFSTLYFFNTVVNVNHWLDILLVSLSRFPSNY